MVQIKDLAGLAPYWRLLGIELVESDDGEPMVRLAVEEKLLQFYGNVHGGAIASLVDAAAAVALNYQLGAVKGAKTVEMKVNYLRAVSAGVLYARGEVVHLGRTIAVSSATVWDDNGKKVAYGSGTFYLVEVQP